MATRPRYVTVWGRPKGGHSLVVQLPGHLNPLAGEGQVCAAGPGHLGYPLLAGHQRQCGPAGRRGGKPC